VNPGNPDTAEIKALARVIDRLDYYRLLKLEPGADASAVRGAYHDARRRYHPDSFLSEAAEVREAVDRIARRITEGYLVLRDRQRRAAYDAALSSGHLRLSAEHEVEAKSEAAAARGATPNGRRYFTLCEEAERQGNLANAIRSLKTAITFERDNEAFKAKLAALEAAAKAARQKAKQ
jgi:DnaJ-class molecular chaperone